MQLAVSGIGVVSPFGVGVPLLLQGLSEGRSGISEDSQDFGFGIERLPGGHLADFAADAFDASPAFSRAGRTTQIATVAVSEALASSGIDSGGDRLGVVFCSARGSLERTERFYEGLVEKGPRLVNPLIFQESVNNAPISHISIRYQLTGPSLTLTTGAVAVFQALEIVRAWIEAGMIDQALMVCGDPVDPISQIAHYVGGGHAPTRRNGTRESCPFDRRRNGYVLGEAAIAMVVENADRAAARGVETYGTIVSSAVVHTGGRAGRVDVEGRGIERAMRSCIAKLDTSETSIDWVLAAANSSAVIDRAELCALQRVFGPRLRELPLTALASMIGETDGAAAGLGMLAGMLGSRAGILFPTINFEAADKDWDIDCVPNAARQAKSQQVLVNAVSFGGGAGACVLRPQ